MGWGATLNGTVFALAACRFAAEERSRQAALAMTRANLDEIARKRPEGRLTAGEDPFALGLGKVRKII